jgi:thiosulfate/3-mercaptopyruvate sulfurtransferase
MIPLVSTSELAFLFSDPSLVIADLRWDSASPDPGVVAYRQGHIPGAIYVDLDTDLSDRSDLSRGRHPLPDPAIFAGTLTRLGIGRDTMLVVYDDKAGSLAARLWWMMRWIGGPAARVLDGGFAQWVKEGGTVETGAGPKILPAAKPVVPNPHPEMVASISDVETLESNTLLLDARAPERYRGESEDLDARAGHIPGARNAPWRENLVDELSQCFRSSSGLRMRFEQVGVAEGKDIICSCGSGVTACHNLLALELAGFPGARLYPGSWSEWVAQRPPSNAEREPVAS